MKTAVVTGAPGWLGTRLVEVLHDGLPDGPKHLGRQPQRPVRVLAYQGASDPRVTKRDHVTWVPGDLLGPLEPLFEDTDEGATVFHCAGVIHPVRSTSEWEEVNVDGTRRLLQAAERAGVGRFIHVSSNSPVGCNPDPSHRFTEDSPYNPYLGYGRSKQRAEEIVDASPLQTVIVRPPWFYGPGQPVRQVTFFSMIRRGRGPLVGDGSNRRSMAYVDNIVQGLLLCEVIEAARGQTYWISDRETYAFHEILDTIEQVLERDFELSCAHRRLRLPWVVGQTAQAIDTVLQAAGLYHQKFHVLGELNKNIACSIAKAEAELGYDPKIALEEGMRRSIADLIERGVEP